MSKTEEFIKSKIRIGSNTSNGWRRKGVFIPSYSLPWLTPDDARRAVKIAREEIYEWLKEKLSTYIDYRCRGVGESVEEFVNDLKHAIEDE